MFPTVSPSSQFFTTFNECVLAHCEIAKKFTNKPDEYVACSIDGIYLQKNVALLQGNLLKAAIAPRFGAPVAQAWKDAGNEMSELFRAIETAHGEDAIPDNETYWALTLGWINAVIGNETVKAIGVEQLKNVLSNVLHRCDVDEPLRPEDVAELTLVDLAALDALFVAADIYGPNETSESRDESRQLLQQLGAAKGGHAWISFVAG